MARKIRKDITGPGLRKRLEGRTGARKIRRDITGRGLAKRLGKTRSNSIVSTRPGIRSLQFSMTAYEKRIYSVHSQTIPSPSVKHNFMLGNLSMLMKP